ncbi:hypothetical protein C7293_26875 [filamentous cyanobacterium CCT1]|nr:hypothetical protein C7293_26875 [filamentous cyanobacterium CCT1]PSN76455.1 hypothetical protein C8B47_27200 [filamentous cyanobacterium CCP4]
MAFSTDQRRQLIQWIAALPPTQFEVLVFGLKPPAGTLSTAPTSIGTRAAELLAWAEGILGPGIAEVVKLLRSSIADVAPSKLPAFDAAFGALHPSREDTEGVCPYQGLEAFTPATRQFFYGRQATVELLLQKLTEFNFVPVIGVSGSGKSSVVRAGLMPNLGPEWLVLEPFKPDAEPMAELRKAMRSLFARSADKNRVTQLLNEDGLLPVLEMLPAALKTGAQKVLLVIDQFEEVFTVCPIEDDRAQFINCITAVQTLKNSPLAIVTTMRGDFVEQWLDYGDLVQTIQHQAVWLGRLQGEDLVQAIEQPTKDMEYTFGPGLLDLILDDVQAEKNCLPLLEFALTELWEKRDQQQKELPLTAYTDMQRLTGALNKRAEDVYNNDLGSDEERQCVKRICLELVRIGPEVKDTRQRQPRLTLLDMGKSPREREVINEVIEALVCGRLLVTTREDEIDLAHEALMAGWQRFAEWRKEDRDRRRLVQRVRDAEKEWNSKGRDERYLLQGGFLAEVRDLWTTLQTAMPSSTQQFYHQSDEQEKEQVTFLEQALTESELREQALKMTPLVYARPLEAAAIAIQSVGFSDKKLNGRITTPVQGSLRTITGHVREYQLLERQGGGVVKSVAFSPDGQTIVSGSGEFLNFWDCKDGYIGQSFLNHERAVWSVAFSPNGQYILSGSTDCTLRLWDHQGNPIGQPFRGHTGAVLSVAFNPDGQTILSGSDDCTVRLWNLQGDPISQPFQGHTGTVWSIAFSPNGQTIISGSDDCTVRLWNLQGDPIGQPFLGHVGAVKAVTFSPDGQIILSGGDDGALRLWNTKGNPIGEPFLTHQDGVSSVAFSPDGQTILSGSSDSTLRLWDRNGNLIDQPLLGHRSTITSVAFSPNGHTIVSSSDDRTLRLWDSQGTSLDRPFSGHTAPISSIACSPDGQTIVSSSVDFSLRLWDFRGNSIGQPFYGHKAPVLSVAFSPNNKIIISGDFDGTLMIWDRQGNSIGQIFLNHTVVVRSVAFSPDSQTIVSGNSDCTVRLWDFQGNVP